jgi:phosphate:Na+ symporter
MNGAAHFLGGLGLFLLGMWLMSEGLKLAAGSALERILADWTRTRPRALLSGILVTGLVQSSSAVTVAIIGFVNAGLLTLSQALWVIFGSNVGTTMTGWLVALVGISVRVEAFALPAIGFGMLLRLTGEGTRRGSVGTALAGFGVLFLGIDVLRDAFSGVSANVNIDAWLGEGGVGMLSAVLLGVVLTTLMQSSSAAMAIVLSAAAGGVVTLPAAAATVIGLNLGTTITAVIAAISATPNARRAASAHVVFNLITAFAALLTLPLLLALVEWLAGAADLAVTPATVLAVFHSVFNVLGVLLMWPLSSWLERVLSRRFRTGEEDEGRPLHLDANVLGVPALALNALALETRRVGVITRRMVLMALAGAAPAALARERAVLERLTRTVAQFVVSIHRSAMGERTGKRLPYVLRLLRDYETIAQLAVQIGAQTDGRTVPEEVARYAARFDDATRNWLAEALPGDTPGVPSATALPEAVPDGYALLKDAALSAAARDELGIDQMEALLERARAMRQAAEHAAKALALQQLDEAHDDLREENRPDAD